MSIAIFVLSTFCRTSPVRTARYLGKDGISGEQEEKKSKKMF
uniref:Uncharacterized protein n=1 Tax=Anguilla anguilla TaxID=7936 RepID=A0A0E9PTC3_ANGAN